MKRILLLLLMAQLFAAGCRKNDPEPSSRVVLNPERLEDLGPSAQYEGWIIVKGTYKSTGKFTVNSSGQLSQNTFDVKTSDLEAAKTFVVTIEPMPDPDASPSDKKLLAGDFTVNIADLTVGHPNALGNNFTGVTGQYLLATPTTTTTADEKSGVWFIDHTDPNSQAAGLANLPVLSAGWQYEGWVVINGTPVSTGKFTSASGADNSAAYSGPMPGPLFPGEDFIQNAPAGLSFPTDLTGSEVMVSIEPVPDNSPAPFILKPLLATVPGTVNPMVNYPLTNNAVSSFPKGTATR